MSRPTLTMPGTLGAAFALFMAAPFAAMAQSATSQNASTTIPPAVSAAQPASWYEHPDMAGALGAERRSLTQKGITFHLDTKMQYGGVISGGKSLGTDYSQQVWAGVDVDLGKLANLQGALLHFYVSDRAGRSISSDYVGGKYINFGNYGAEENFRLMNLSYEQKWFGGRVNTLIGNYPLGNEFANTPELCTFTSQTSCAHTQFFLSASGWLNAPNATWGGRVRFNITPSLYAETGIFESNPLISTHTNYGWHLGLQGATGSVIPVEFGETVELGPDHLSGTYKIGGYYDNSEVADVAYSKVKRRGRYGGYIVAKQVIYNIDQSGQRNVQIFGQVNLGDDRTAALPVVFSAAAIVTGPFAARPDDLFGVSWTKSNVNSRALAAEYGILRKAGNQETLYQSEQLLEVIYTFRLLPWLSFSPDLQYDINPGAFTYKKYDSAWIASGQLQLHF